MESRSGHIYISHSCLGQKVNKGRVGLIIGPPMALKTPHPHLHPQHYAESEYTKLDSRGQNKWHLNQCFNKVVQILYLVFIVKRNFNSQRNIFAIENYDFVADIILQIYQCQTGPLISDPKSLHCNFSFRSNRTL